MARDRRTFLKLSALAGGALALPGSTFASAQQAHPSRPAARTARMKLTFRPYTLELKHVFTIAVSSRTTTPVVLTEIAYGGLVGYGEASMPPYLGETQETAAAFLSKVDLSRYPDPLQLETILADIDALAPGNQAAKAGPGTTSGGSTSPTRRTRRSPSASTRPTSCARKCERRPNTRS